MINSEEIDKLLYQTLPSSRSVLSNNTSNLQQIANYCDENYLQAKDKNKALAETKNFATRSLAHVAYQIHKIASEVITMLDLQVVNADYLTSNISMLGQTVAVHKEKVARREIGVLTANKTSHRIQGTKDGFIFPQHEDIPKKYIRQGIDYSILDNIGHGVKSESTVKRSVSTVQRPSNTNIHANIPLTGTISRGSNLSRQASAVSSVSRDHHPQHHPQQHPQQHPSQSQYRVPIAAPNVPSHYAPGHYTGHRATPPSTPSTSSASSASLQHRHKPNNFNNDTTIQQTTAGNTKLLPMPGLDPGLSDGNVSPPLPPPPPIEMSPYAPAQFEGQAMGAPPTPVLPAPQQMRIPCQESITPPPVQFIPPLNNQLYPEPVYIERVRAIYDYTKDKDDELTFTEGSIILVTKKNDDGWFEGVLDGMNGLFPGNYVEPI